MQTMKRQLVDAMLNVRVTQKFRDKFNKKARRYGPSAADVHREILEAFVDDRLQIVPPPNSNSRETLYVNRTENN